MVIKAKTSVDTLTDGRSAALLATTGGRTDLNGPLLDLVSGAPTTIISSSGIGPGKVIYHMEMTAVSIQANKLYICDYRNMWYYRGIEGLTETMGETIDLVGELLARLKPTRSIAMGTSGGGYMGMPLGARLGLDRVVAFAPQTIISRSGRAALNDTRWEQEMRRIYFACGEENTYDIREEVAASASNQTQFHVFYSTGDAADTGHAERLIDLSQVRLYPVDTIEHNVSRFLRDRGFLQQ